MGDFDYSLIPLLAVLALIPLIGIWGHYWERKRQGPSNIRGIAAEMIAADQARRPPKDS